MAEPSKRRRRLRAVLKWGLVSFLLAQAFFWWSVRLPKPDVEVPTLAAPVVEGARVSRPGGGFLERREGYWFFLHRGDAVTLGAEHAVLGEFLIQRVEDAMFADFEDRMPGFVRLLLPPVLLWQYRHMPRHIPESQLEELWGFSTTYADRHSFPLSAYRRGMYYHALHDITQALIGNPYVDPAYAGACTGFAASGSATTDGHLVMGRNFDFEVFPLFDQEKVVHLYARDGAIPVLSVSWMAMAGVVTGMNADGVWMSVNAAASEGRSNAGPPVSLWIRSILEQARSVEDVRALLTAEAPMVSDIYLVGDGKTGEAVVFERGQTRIGERPMTDGRLTAANHLLSAEFEGDADDASLRRRSSTTSRHLRMHELVGEAPLSVERGQQILRDRRAPGGSELPPGNRNAIDALIATHATVADVTARVMWVSTAPHTQGAWRKIDLLDELDRAGIDTATWRATLPAAARPWEAEPTGSLHEVDGLPPPAPGDLPPGDLLLGDGWDTLVLQRSYLADGEAYLADDEPGRARSMAERAEATLPGTPAAAMLEGDACLADGDEACAVAAYTRYLQRFPSFGPDHQRIVDWLQAHGGVPDVHRPDDR